MRIPRRTLANVAAVARCLDLVAVDVKKQVGADITATEFRRHVYTHSYAAGFVTLANAEPMRIAEFEEAVRIFWMPTSISVDAVGVDVLDRSFVDEGDGFSSVVRGFQWAEIQRAADALPDRHRLVVALYYYEDLSPREIGDTL